MNILIEGWRGINHSFSLVNQWQIIELLKTSNIYFKDVKENSKIYKVYLIQCPKMDNVI